MEYCLIRGPAVSLYEAAEVELRAGYGPFLRCLNGPEATNRDENRRGFRRRVGFSTVVLRCSSTHHPQAMPSLGSKSQKIGNLGPEVELGGCGHRWASLIMERFVGTQVARLATNMPVADPERFKIQDATSYDAVAKAATSLSTSSAYPRQP